MIRPDPFTTERPIIERANGDRAIIIAIGGDR